MKKRTMMLLVAVFATLTSLMAQPKTNRVVLSAEQKEQIKDVREQYAPKIKDIKDDLRLKQVEQKTLLSSEKVDEKAVYATIDAISDLKAALHKETSAMHAEIKTICPNANKVMAYRNNNKHPMQGQAYRQGNGQGRNNAGMRNAQGQGKQMNNMRAGQGRQGMQQGQNGKKQCIQGNNGQKGQGRYNCDGNGPRNKQGMYQNGYAQGRHNQGMMFGANCQLSDEQKTVMADIKKEHFWGIQETQNELALLKASNTTWEERQAAFSKINTLQTKLAKQRMAMKLELMSQLTEEQRMLAISKMNHKKLNGQAMHRAHRNR